MPPPSSFPTLFPAKLRATELRKISFKAGPSLIFGTVLAAPQLIKDHQAPNIIAYLQALHSGDIVTKYARSNTTRSGDRARTLQILFIVILLIILFMTCRFAEELNKLKIDQMNDLEVLYSS